MKRKESSQNSGARSQNLASWSVAFLLFFSLHPSIFLLRLCNLLRRWLAGEQCQ